MYYNRFNGLKFGEIFRRLLWFQEMYVCEDIAQLNGSRTHTEKNLSKLLKIRNVYLSFLLSPTSSDPSGEVYIQSSSYQQRGEKLLWKSVYCNCKHPRTVNNLTFPPRLWLCVQLEVRRSQRASVWDIISQLVHRWLELIHTGMTLSHPHCVYVEKEGARAKAAANCSVCCCRNVCFCPDYHQTLGSTLNRCNVNVDTKTNCKHRGGNVFLTTWPCVICSREDLWMSFMRNKNENLK